jgi:hypothetical protein
MRTSVWIGLSVLLIIAGLSVREWLIVEEIQTLRVEFKDQIQDGIRQTQSVERLEDFKKIQFVNERYLEPVILLASRQIWPGAAQREILNWRRELHATLSDQLYLKQASLQEKVTQEISGVRLSEKPSVARLQNVVAMTEALDSALERTRLIKEELEAMQAATKAADQTALDQLKKVGKQSLALLRKKARNLQSSGLANYLTSAAYEAEVEKPVLDLVFSIRHPQLRQKAWEEFNEQRRKIFSNRFKSIAKNSSPQLPEPKAENTLAEVLKREFDRELERERLLQIPAQAPIGPNPNDSHTPRSLDAEDYQ